MNQVIIPPDGGAVKVRGAPHPFRVATSDVELQEGHSISEMLEIVQPDEVLRRHAHVYVDDWLIPRDRWHAVRPRAGRTVTIRVVPEGGGGGGKSTFRILLTIAVIAAAAYFGPALGAALLPGLSVGIQTSIGTALIGFGGNLLLNMIAPIRPPSLNAPGVARNDAESPSFFLDQARNTFRPYAPVPVIFGRHRVVPTLGASVVTEALGDVNHLRMLVVWGYGPLRITDIKIDETPIANFDDVRIETREGRPGDADITLYPDDIDQQNFSITLSNTSPDSAGPWTTRRSADNADELSVDIAFPRGLAQFDDQGTRILNTAEIRIQYQKVGDSSWSTPTFTSRTGGLVSGSNIEFQGSSTQPLRYGFRWSTGERAQYDVRVRRVDQDDAGEDRRYSEVVWSTLRSITDQPPIDFPVGLAVSAIDIRATDQLNRAVDQLNGVVEAEAMEWDGTDWAVGYTRNPASAFRLALQSPARREAAQDSEIDLDSLEDWHEFCDTNGYRFDFVNDTRRSVWDLLADICAAGRASPTRTDDKWGVVVDTGAQVVRQHITPLNASGFELKRSFEPAPDALRITFPNEDEGWRRDEMIVYNDNYDDTNAQIIPTLNPSGITDPDHIYKFGRFQLAQMLLRRELWTANMDFEHLVARRGSRITCQHDALAVGLASGRIASWETNSSNDVTAITLDAPIQFPRAVAYSAKIRTVADADIVASITVVGGADTDAVSRLAFSSPQNITLQAGALVSVGESGVVTIDGLVTGISRSRNLTARVSMVPYQSGVYLAETGAIPAFDSKISGALSILTMTVLSVDSGASVVRLIGTVYLPGILIVVRPSGREGAVIECQIRPTGTGQAYQAAEVRQQSRNSIEIGGVQSSRDYDLRLRWVLDGRVGGWANINGHTVQGLAAAVPTSVTVDGYTDGTRRYTFTLPDEPYITGVEIRYVTGSVTSPDWDTMTPVATGLLTASPHETLVPENAGTYTFLFRAVSTDGTLSNAVRVEQSLARTRIAGQQWFYRTGTPDNSLGQDGDLLIRTDNNTVYEKRSGAWVEIADLSGADGAAGATWRTGTGVPADTLGDNGDYYFQTGTTAAAGTVYRKESGTWDSLFDIGGGEWLSGTGVPAGSLGKVGDFFFRTDQGYVYEKTDDTVWTFLRDITGPQGIGGTDGTDGTDGATWHTGNGAPIASLGEDDDLYFRVSNSTVWEKSSGTWTQIASLAGADGATWYTGSTAPADTLGSDTDWYFQTGSGGVAGSIYRKVSGSWVLQVDIDQGVAGDDGATWLSGSGAPANSAGNVGDWYFRTSNGFVYEKTGETAWTFRRDITGPQGSRGPGGATGPTGPIGPIGPQGPQGPAGDSNVTAWYDRIRFSGWGALGATVTPDPKGVSTQYRLALIDSATFTDSTQSDGSIHGTMGITTVTVTITS